MQERQTIRCDHGWNIRVVDETDSTNDALKRQLDAPHGTVLIARRQTGGRGRLGRQFLSPLGGLYLSVLLRPQVPSDQLLHLTPMTAVAVRRAISDCCGVSAQIKWTNDLVFGGRKLCGILTELSCCEGSLQSVIVGVGINCNTDIASLDPSVSSMATSLAQIVGHRVEEEALASAVIFRLQQMDAALLTQKAAWMEEYAAACITVGRQVQILCGGERRQAYAEGIDENGGLLVRYENGETAAVTAGEVSVRGMYGYL